MWEIELPAGLPLRSIVAAVSPPRWTAWCALTSHMPVSSSIPETTHVGVAFAGSCSILSLSARDVGNIYLCHKGVYDALQTADWSER